MSGEPENIADNLQCPWLAIVKTEPEDNHLPLERVQILQELIDFPAYLISFIRACFFTVFILVSHSVMRKASLLHFSIHARLCEKVVCVPGFKHRSRNVSNATQRPQNPRALDVCDVKLSVLVSCELLSNRGMHISVKTSFLYSDFELTPVNCVRPSSISKRISSFDICKRRVHLFAPTEP